MAGSGAEYRPRGRRRGSAAAITRFRRPGTAMPTTPATRPFSIYDGTTLQTVRSIRKAPSAIIGASASRNLAGNHQWNDQSRAERRRQRLRRRMRSAWSAASPTSDLNWAGGGIATRLNRFPKQFHRHAELHDRRHGHRRRFRHFLLRVARRPRQWRPCVIGQ